MKSIGNFKNAKKYLWALYFFGILKSPALHGLKSFGLWISVSIFTAALVLLTSFVHDAQFNITHNLTNSLSGHIIVSGAYRMGSKECKGVLHYPQIMQITEQVLGETCRIVPRYSLPLPISFKGQKKQIQFTGVDCGQESMLKNQLTFVEGSWAEFEKNSDGILLPIALARYFKINLSERLNLALFANVDTLSSKIVKVAGIYQSKNYFLGSLALAHFRLLQELDRTAEDTASNLCIFLDDADNLGSKRERLLQAFSQYGFPTYKPVIRQAAGSVFPATATSGDGGRHFAANWQEPATLVLATSDEVLGNIGRLVSITHGIGLLLLELMLFVIGVAIFITWRQHARQDASVKLAVSEAIHVHKSYRELFSRVRIYVMENIFLILLFMLFGIGLAILTLVFMHQRLGNWPEAALGRFLIKNS